MLLLLLFGWSQLVKDLEAAGFDRVAIGAATGRHFALVAKKPSVAPAGPPRCVVDDQRWDPATGAHRKADTHLKTWESKK